MKRLYHRAKAALRPKAMVLMYHRIAKLDSDIWDIAVSPEHFEEQLQVLKKSGKVVPLRSLVADYKAGNIKRGAIALSFDDGYADNYLVAKPLLEKYGIPATFFITTGNIGQQKEFWWDELEQLLLFTQELPRQLKIKLGGEEQHFDFDGETQLSEKLLQAYRNWKASLAPPPGIRANHYLQIWQQLQALPHIQQLEKLRELRNWAGQQLLVRVDYLSMSVAQLRDLHENPLFDVGLHTVNHPALACHGWDYQLGEITGSQQFLERSLGNPVTLLAYPFGINNATTLAIAAEMELLAAFTTKEESISSASHPYRLGRYQIKDWSGSNFEQNMQQWNKISLIRK